MYKSGGLKKSIKASRKMKKGGANDIQGIDVDSLPQNIQQQAVKLNGLIIEYNNVKDDSQKNVTALLNIANQIVEILKILAPSKPGIFGIFSRKQTTAAAPPAPAPATPLATAADQQAEEEEEEEEATKLPQQIQVTPPTEEEAPSPLAAPPLTEEQKAEAARQNAITVGGRKKKATRKVKRGGAIDMSKLYNVSGLIVDSKDPVAMAAQVSQDNTPMPFSSSGQGITYSAGIPEQFMRDLNPTLGMAGGKKRTTGSAKTQDKQRAGSAKTQDKKRKDSAKTKSKK